MISARDARMVHIKHVFHCNSVHIKAVPLYIIYSYFYNSQSKFMLRVSVTVWTFRSLLCWCLLFIAVCVHMFVTLCVHACVCCDVCCVYICTCTFA